MNKVEYIDFAKGYAIFTIVLFHTLQHAGLSPLLQQGIVYGGSGVHLFFLLSGFGLALSRSAFSPLEFYRRRALKVWLPYVLILTISLGFAYAMNLFTDRLPGYFAGVFLYQMFFEKYILSFGGHFWFISAIIQFYVAYPLLVWLKNRFQSNLARFIGLSLLVSLLWWQFVFVQELGGFRIWNSFFLQFVWEFALGMALAEAFKGSGSIDFGFAKIKGDFWNYTWWLYLPIGLFFTGLMVFIILKLGDVGKTFNDIPTLIGYTALSVFVYQFSARFFEPLKRFFLWISTFSYSLYLSHLLVLVLYLRLLETVGTSPNILSLPPFVPLALLIGRAFEPLSQWWVRTFEKIF